MEHVSICIRWRGPYREEDLPGLEGGNGLYMVTGMRKYQRSPSILYFGITERAFSRRFYEHHKIGEVTRGLEVWLGEIVSPPAFDRTHLETAESVLVYFWGPELNERKKLTPPRPTTVVSHWFKPDGTPRKNQKGIYRDLHDVLSWDGELWRTGNLAVW